MTHTHPHAGFPAFPKHTCESCQDKGYIHTTGHPSLPEGTTYIERCDECFQEGRVAWTDKEATEFANTQT